MKHLLTLWMLALCLCVSAKETCPKVIPALQEWKGGSGKLVLPAEGSIVVAPADEAALKSVATVLAQDLKDLLDWNYTIRTGKPGKNDIYLSLMKPDKQLGKEGYVLTAGRYAGIEAPVRESFGEPGVCCRFFIMKKESCPKELPVTGRNIPVVASCWMWAVSSSQWISCGNMSKYYRSIN
jgi:hypothetical protein